LIAKAYVIIPAFPVLSLYILMEAEHLNQIEASLADLAERATQLRGLL